MINRMKTRNHVAHVNAQFMYANVAYSLHEHVALVLWDAEDEVR